jgi:hypothetical protein
VPVEYLYDKDVSLQDQRGPFLVAFTYAFLNHSRERLHAFQLAAEGLAEWDESSDVVSDYLRFISEVDDLIAMLLHSFRWPLRTGAQQQTASDRPRRPNPDPLMKERDEYIYELYTKTPRMTLKEIKTEVNKSHRPKLGSIQRIWQIVKKVAEQKGLESTPSRQER